MSEETYLELAVETSLYNAAVSALHEQVLAELPPTADELAQQQAVADYDKSLVEKYRGELVEEDLLPLLDKLLGNWSVYYNGEDEAK